ncbi:ribonucleoside triphosphate reductase [Neomoorella thermoacetica]|uniref:ribonucleoside triphosphate reductase n=1 Tax=Neomoorella thermoacetica TaxID=1525 RepID=UPI0009195EBF|nr:ribonucleoside triphosphate reductase [Moorella thermoacetica]OIQ11401.1 anaerobic ribonucleoside-triphosphate reductase [Moorella thermoacetica]
MIPKKIIKRDGRVVDFDEERIINAIYKAAQAVGGQDRRQASQLANQVTALLAEKFVDRLPTVEDVQDLVEKVLIENGHARTAKAYILYRQQHAEWRDFRHLLVNVQEMVQGYLDGQDWRINENSNMNYSLQGLNNHIIAAVSSRYWLEKVYPPAIREAHERGDIHIHDLGLLAPYCCGWDLADLLESGFAGVGQKVESAPPRHFRTALGQIANFFYTLQGEAAGAQAFSSFDTYLAPFIRYDGLDYREVKQALQEFIFNLNVPTRVGFQTPFVNLTMDVVVPQVLAGEPVIIGGERRKECYGDFQQEMDWLNIAFCEVMMEGDARGRIFTFPIPTYNITPDFPWESPVADRIMAMTAKYGIPYFANFINSDLKPEDVRSMCLFPEEDILIRENGIIRKLTIGELFEQTKGQQLDHEWFEVDNFVEALSLNPKSGKLEWVEIKRLLKVTDRAVVHIRTKDGKTMRVSPDHLVAVYTKDGITTKKARDIIAGDFLLVMRDGSKVLNQETEFVSRELASGFSTIDRWGITTETIEWLRNADFAVVEAASSTVEQLDYDQVFYDIELGKNHYFVHSQGNITHNCCRLRLDNRELKKRGGGLFGANPLTGSIGVVTINLPRLGYVSSSKEEFFTSLKAKMDLAKESLLLKRNILEKLTEQGLYPYSRFYLRQVKERFGRYWENHFNTIGIVGMHEALLNFMKKGIETRDGRGLALEILDFMRSVLATYQAETGQLFNLEATPAEGTSYRLARLDRRLYPDIITSGTNEPYYTNSTHLPVGYTDDVFTALEHQDELQLKYTGGTVFHAYLGERVTDTATCRRFLQTVMHNFRLPYFTITPTFSICPEHGYLSGEHWTCPACGRETEVWSRIVGYYRPVKNWNKGKQEEFRERRGFRPVACRHGQTGRSAN